MPKAGEERGLPYPRVEQDVDGALGVSGREVVAAPKGQHYVTRLSAATGPRR